MAILPQPLWLRSKNKYWKFIAAFLGICFLVGAGFFIWSKYLSPEAKSEMLRQKQSRQYLDWEQKYQSAMKNDVYGGKTPEETLTMFSDALEKGDIELASKYFVLREDGSVDPKWFDGLNKERENGNLERIYNTISKMEYDKDSSYAGNAWYVLKNKDGIVEYSVILHFNNYSNVWKIESL